jgi:hypothetical protein
MGVNPAILVPGLGFLYVVSNAIEISESRAQGWPWSARQVVRPRAGAGADLSFANADAESRMLRTVDDPRRFQPRAAPRDALQGSQLRHEIHCADSDPGSAPHGTRPQPAVHLSNSLDCRHLAASRIIGERSHVR